MTKEMESTIENLKKLDEFFLDKDEIASVNRAIKYINMIDEIDHILEVKMESDKRNINNRETEDGLFYDGIQYCRKLIDEKLFAIK